MELVCAADAGLSPEDGELIMAASGLSAQLDGGLLRVGITPADGQAIELLLSLRSGEGDWR